MKESDFSQFSDPRVREVMAAAANLVEDLGKRVVFDVFLQQRITSLKTALFAAQHSKPRREPPCPPCLIVDDADAKAHSKLEKT